MARGIADAVGIDLRRPQAVEETLREAAGQQRAGAGIMAMQDGLGAMFAQDSL